MTELPYSIAVAISSLTGTQLILSLKRSSHHDNGETLRALKDGEGGLSMFHKHQLLSTSVDSLVLAYSGNHPGRFLELDYISLDVFLALVRCISIGLLRWRDRSMSVEGCPKPENKWASCMHVIQ